MPPPRPGTPPTVHAAIDRPSAPREGRGAGARIPGGVLLGTALLAGALILAIGPARAATTLTFAWTPNPQTPQVDVAIDRKLFAALCRKRNICHR